jgi:group II intron reverse transcriptase/maturase
MDGPGRWAFPRSATGSLRIAQEVVKRYLEPILEPVFHDDSYGYRPGRSAIDALRTPRQRCWRFDWVLDIDVQSYFDSIDWELLLKAVRHHTDRPWVLLYIERWLKAPVQMQDGSIVPRTAGTPQGGVISPVLANLFLHYVFDVWMARSFPAILFERYADDIICHCRSEAEARTLWGALEVRFRTCGLVLHPAKTKIVYCKDTNRRGDYPVQSFDFLGYSFRPRKAAWRDGRYGTSFLPAASPKALKAIRQTIRGWAFHHRTDKSLADLARMFRPYIQGWINYYGRFYKSELTSTLHRIDAFLIRWTRNKFKRLRRRPKGTREWLAQVIRANPHLFAHWRFRIRGKLHYLWRAVDQHGNVLDILVQSRRTAKAAKRLLRKLLKRQGIAPRVLVTDKLASYAAAKRTVMPSVERRQHKGLNNRAENSHQPTRRLDHDRWGHLTLWSAAEQGSCGLRFLPVPRATQGCWPGRPPPLSRSATPRLCAHTGMEGCRFQQDPQPEPAPAAQSRDIRQS